MDVLEQSKKLAEKDGTNLYVWQDARTGEPVDSWIANPDVAVFDDGHAERLSARLGEPIVFAGRVAVEAPETTEGVA